MDIFEMAEIGMKIQADEKLELEQEQLEAETQKSYKIDIKEAIDAASRKDYDWFNRLGEHQKNFQPFIMNLWLSMVWTQNGSKSLNDLDKKYAETLKEINTTLNCNLFQVSKEMFWLLACTVQKYINIEYDKNGKRKKVGNYLDFKFNWVKSEKKTSSEKYNKKVIEYISQELYSSSEKIIDMIDNGLITADNIKEIEKDLETLEKPKK